METVLALVYHPDYLKYDFGSSHPFWPERAKVFLNRLAQGLAPNRYWVEKPAPASDGDILLVHTGSYLDRVKRLAKERGALSVDTPLNPDVLQAAYASVAGSILAAKLALGGCLAINLLGGLHHAGVAESSGFCVFNDHAIAIRKLQKEKKIKTAFVLDLDVHAGQGTQEIFYQDASVFTVSLHQDPTTLYPGTGFSEQRGEGEGFGYNLNVILPPGTGETEYLTKLDQVLPLINEFNPDLLAVILGVDTYRQDPLASLRLAKVSYERIGQRIGGLKVKKFICFAGGYSREAPELWLRFIHGLVTAGS